MADVRVKKTIEGATAHDDADAGNPLKLGHRAVSHGATPASVAANDVSDWYANRAGVPFIIGGHPNVETLTRKDTGAQTDAVLKTVNANERFVITAVAVLCDNANSVDVQALVEIDDTADIRVVEHPGIPPGGGFTHGNGGGILAIGIVAGDVLWTCSVPTGGSVVVSVSGYLIIEA
jgi:hypothetical protein